MHQNIRDIPHYQDIHTGPVSVAINAGPIMSYKSGVFNDTCEDYLDHGVTVVGYGTDPNTTLDYWLVKNSWGTDWGDNGYFRIARGRNLCGISEYVSYPVVS